MLSIHDCNVQSKMATERRLRLDFVHTVGFVFFGFPQESFVLFRESLRVFEVEDHADHCRVANAGTTDCIDDTLMHAQIS